jgi:amino acid transporter
VATPARASRAQPTVLLKRLLVGRPFRTDRVRRTLLPKRIALPVFAADPLSSVAYAPAEILLTLSLAGAAAYVYAPWIAAAVVVVLLTVVASYRQNVHAYPSGGGDYEVATVNLGRRPGLVVASALLVDYVLTVAVSVAAGVDNLASAVDFVGEHRVAVAVGIVVLLATVNLRGIRDSGLAFALPTYAFLIGMVALVGWGYARVWLLGDELRAPSADLEVVGGGTVAGFALAFLLARAFSSGSVALTGVEAIANGVPEFRHPKSRNAATVLLIVGLISTALVFGIIGLARLSHLQYVEDPARQIVGAGPGYEQPTVTAQLASTVFGGFQAGYVFVLAATVLILVLAANTAFNGFPMLGSILAQDRYLPRQLHTRGDRLAFSNGILFLAVFAIVLIVAFDAQTTRLIQLYIVGVFVAFTVSQVGMVRHWNRLLRTERDAATRRRMHWSRAVNGFGAVLTGSVLVLVLATKFTHGAWISVVAMALLYGMMVAIRRHYDRVARELDATGVEPRLPSRNHAVVLVSTVHKPTLRAIAYAQATRPDTLTCLTVNVDETDTRRIQQQWEEHDIGVPLTVIESPYREITRPIVEYVKARRRDAPRDVVTVFIPEYVVGRWWEHLLHNQSALRIKTRLLFEPGVMVTSVPYQLASSSMLDLDRYDEALSRGPAPGPRSAREHPAGRPVSGDRGAGRRSAGDRGAGEPGGGRTRVGASS